MPVVLVGVAAINIIYFFGAFDSLAELTAPVMTRLLGLPRGAIVAVLVGFLRKDMAVGMLEPLNLTPGQLVVACTVLSMFFPCIATFTVLYKELGLRDLFKSTGIMIVASLLTGAVLNFVFSIAA
jgi:ferrous iron transport protein B